VLWSLSGISNMQLSGPIGVAADFSGRVQAPQLAGIIRANNLTFVHETYGTRISQLALRGRFTSSELQIEQLSGRAGRGTINGTGTVGFAAAAGYPMDIRLRLADAQLARSDAIGATLSGDLAITNSRANGALISGELNLPELRYEIIRQGAAQVIELQGVRRKGEPLPPPGGDPEADQGTPSIWKLDLRVRADNELYVSGMGLESEWSADLRIQGTSATPSMTGEAELIRGTYSFSGRRFDVTRGRIAFTGARPPNPRIDLVASSDIKGVTVNINVSGTALNPQIAFTSSRPAAGRDHGPDPVRRLGDRDLRDPGGPARLVAEQPARRRRRPQPARQAALRGRFRSPPDPRRRRHDRPRHRHRRRLLPLRRRLSGDHHRRPRLHRHPDRDRPVEGAQHPLPGRDLGRQQQRQRPVPEAILSA
jgi:translocation and assembly module TamB